MVRECLRHPQIVNQIASALNSTFIPTRKNVLEILVGLVRWEGPEVVETHPIVVSALENLSTTNNETASPYAFWFKSFASALTGRGKMGSLVGASDEIKRNAGMEASLNDYAVSSTSTSMSASRN